MTTERLIAWAGMLAALLLLAVSTFMNLRYGLSLAKTDIDRWIFAATSVGADAMKALAPFFIWSAWRARRWIVAGAATLLWSVCTVYAVASALGFAALTRAEVVGTTAGKQETLAGLRADYARKEGQRSALGAVQPASLLTTEIEQQTKSWRWPASKECRDITLKETRTFCDAVDALIREQGRASEAARLDAEMVTLRERIAALSAVGAVDRGDAQAGFISQLAGTSFANTQMALTLLAVVLVELGSALGLFVVARFTNLSKTAALAAVETDPQVSEIGDVAQFVLLELVEDTAAVLPLTDVHRRYERWCSFRNCRPLDAAGFVAVFEKLAAEIGYGIEARGDRLCCVGLSDSSSDSSIQDCSRRRHEQRAA